MRKFPLVLATTAIAALTANVASAQTLSNWSGPYVGIVAGYANSNAQGSFSVPADFIGPAGSSAAADAGLSARASSVTSLSDNAFTGGAIAGYNIQAQGLVVGLEVELSSLRLKNSARTVGLSDPIHLWRNTVDAEVSTNWLFTARPRAGFAVGQMLFYATGGLAVTRLHGFQSQFNEDLCCGPSLAGYAENASNSKIKYGWTIGGGIEYALTRNWNVRAEYLHTDFGRINATGVTTLPSVYNLQGRTVGHAFDLDAQLVRAGITYEF